MRKKYRLTAAAVCIVMAGTMVLGGCGGKNEAESETHKFIEQPLEMSEEQSEGKDFEKENSAAEEITAENGNEQTGNNSTEREKIVVWSYFETPAQRQSMDELVRDFNQSQNVYEAAWEYIPMIGFNKSLSSAYTENNLPDMAILDNPDMPEMIQLGLFEDITEYVEEWNLTEEFYPSIVETVQHEGKYYGVPFNCNNTALVYNKTVFEEAGLTPPTTWEELRETALALVTEEREGFMMCAIEGEQGAFQILPWLLAAGENPQELGGEKTEEAFAFLQTMLEEGSLSQNCINLTQTDLSREFVDGKVAMMQNGPWVFPILEEAGIDYGVVPIPGEVKGTAVVGGENIGVLKGKNLEGSIAFISFCMERENITDFCSTANVLPGNTELAKEVAAEKENLQAFAEQMTNAVTRTSIPHWLSVRECLTDGFFSLVAGEKTPEEIAEEIREASLS